MQCEIVDAPDARPVVEAELHRAQMQLKAILQAIPDALVFVDMTHRVLECTPSCQAVLGYAADELTGTSVMQLCPGLDPVLSRGPLDSPVELTCQHADGKDFAAEAIASPVMDADKQQLGWAILLRNITARKQLEAELRQAQKMEAVGRLAGGVAHDFNNMLTVVLGSIDMAVIELEENGLDSDWRGELNEAVQASHKAVNLTRQLLTLSKRRAVKPQRLDLNEVVAGSAELLRRLIGEDVQLVLQLSPRPLWVETDQAQMEQVLLNLAINARDAMPEGGTLEIDSVAPGDAHVLKLKPGRYSVIAVTDTGCGIAKDVLERIFDPFFTTKPHGTGLGLSTVYTIVQQTGGSVWVYSEPGRGTTFKIYLPLEPEGEQPEEDGSTVGSAERIGRGESILLVEDDESLRRLAKRVLEREGFEVLATHDATAAREAEGAFGRPIHLLLTDVVMPGIDGIALAQEMAARHPEMLIIFTSGYTRESMVHRGFLEKRVNFLEKPYTPQGLVEAVQAALQITRPEEPAGEGF
ncbi:MAG: hybrid sensor histidine kinase/response regulator [Candidatus Xenobia bacterium]